MEREQFRIESTLVRKQLIELIGKPLQARVTTITGGAGSGKTTLAMQWILASARDACWCTLDSDDNVPVALAGHLRHVLGKPDQAEFSGRPEEVISRSLAEHASRNDIATLVIDDLHLLTNPECHGLLEFLLAHLPPTLTVILISRRRIPLRLGRLRAQDLLREIGREHLWFSPAELLKVLAIRQQYECPDDQLVRIAAESGGWITGFLLATRPHWQNREIDDRDCAFQAERQRFLDEYVREEILDSLQPDHQQFLLETADLPFLSEALCDAVCPHEQRSVRVADLERSGYAFFRPGPDQQSVRHPALIQASLRRLASGLQTRDERLSRAWRACHWLMTHDFLPEAAELALLANDEHWLAEMVLPWLHHLAVRSDFEPLAAWLERMPEACALQRPEFGDWSILARLGVGRTDGVDALICAQQERFPETGFPR